MEFVRIIMAVSIVPLGVIAIFIALPYYLAKITEWENNPLHWSHQVDTYEKGLGSRYAVYLRMLPAVICLLIVITLELGWTGIESLIFGGLTVICFAQFYSFYRFVLFKPTERYERSFLYLSAMVVVLILYLVGIFGPFTSVFLLYIFGAIWGCILFKYKALSKNA